MTLKPLNVFIHNGDTVTLSTPIHSITTVAKPGTYLRVFPVTEQADDRAETSFILRWRTGRSQHHKTTIDMDTFLHILATHHTPSNHDELSEKYNSDEIPLIDDMKIGDEVRLSASVVARTGIKPIIPPDTTFVITKAILNPLGPGEDEGDDILPSVNQFDLRVVGGKFGDHEIQIFADNMKRYCVFHHRPTQVEKPLLTRDQREIKKLKNELARAENRIIMHVKELVVRRDSLLDTQTKLNIVNNELRLNQELFSQYQQHLFAIAEKVLGFHKEQDHLPEVVSQKILQFIKKLESEKDWFEKECKAKNETIKSMKEAIDGVSQRVLNLLPSLCSNYGEVGDKIINHVEDLNHQLKQERLKNRFFQRQLNLQHGHTLLEKLVSDAGRSHARSGSRCHTLLEKLVSDAAEHLNQMDLTEKVDTVTQTVQSPVVMSTKQNQDIIITVGAQRRRVLRDLADRAINFGFDQLGTTTPIHVRAIKGMTHAFIRGHVYSDYFSVEKLNKLVDEAVSDAIAGIK